MVEAVLKGFGLGLLLAISVGPVIFAIIKQSLSNGKAAGYAFIGGVSASDISLVVVCNFFSTLFETALRHKNTIAIAGSIFLFILAIYTFFFKKETIENNDTSLDKIFKKRQLAAIFSSGFLMNTLNPSVFIFWLVWSAAIVADSATANNPVQYRWIVFVTCLVVVLTSDILKVKLAGKLRPKLTLHNLQVLNKISAFILFAFAVGLCIKTLYFKW
jgi:threonine/homoserine/homoserine lactone efflux protein